PNTLMRDEARALVLVLEVQGRSKQKVTSATLSKHLQLWSARAAVLQSRVEMEWFSSLAMEKHADFGAHMKQKTASDALPRAFEGPGRDFAKKSHAQVTAGLELVSGRLFSPQHSLTLFCPPSPAA